MRGLRLGADDWITKPCHPEEVIARVQSVVRRRRRSASRAVTKPVSAGELEIRSDRFQAFVGDQSIDLTRREFELIELLAAAEGRVLEREDIYSSLWGYTMVRGDRSVDVFVRKLRQKLEKASPKWRYIHTHFGIGYRFAAEPIEVDVPESLPAEWSPAQPPPDPPPAIRASSRGRSRTTSSPPAALSSLTTARPPFFRSGRAPVRSPTTPDRSGSWPTSSRRPSAGRPASSASAWRASKPPASGGCTASSSRCCGLQCSAASSAVRRARTLGLNRTASKLACSRSSAIPAACAWPLAALGQTALGVRACAVWRSASP